MKQRWIRQYLTHPSLSLNGLVLGISMAIAVLSLGKSVHCQDYSATDGSTPSAVAPGNAAGSYQIGGIDSINFYNGNLNLSLPLLKVGGRGDASATLAFRLNSKSWHLNHHESIDPNTGLPVVGHTASPSSWYGTDTSLYGPGSLMGRSSNDGVSFVDCQISGGGVNRNVWKTTLTRLTFIGPDGSETELTDTTTQGEPKYLANPCNGGYNRGKVFSSHDGSGLTFVSDSDIVDYNKSTGSGSNPYRKIAPTGYMFLPNGTRVRVEASKIAWLRDRNGNRISFSYDSQSRLASVTDALGRQSTIITYGTSSDQISFAGYNGATRTITINRDSLGNCLKSGDSLSSIYNLFPETGNTFQTSTFNPTVTSTIVLPDGRPYQFKYSKYGEVAKLTLPTGGALEYTYTSGSGVVTAGDFGVEIYRRLTAKKTYADALDSNSITGTLTIGSQATGSCSDYCGSVEVKQLDADGTTVLTRDLHYFGGDPLSSFSDSAYVGYTSWTEGREFQTRSYKVNGNDSYTELRRTDMTYEQRAHFSWWQFGDAAEPANDPRPVKTVTTMSDVGTKSKQTFAYESGIQYNNQTDLYEYDFGSSESSLPLKRHTHTTYLHTNAISGTSYIYDAVQFDTNGNLDLTNTIYIRGLAKEKYVYGVNTSGQELTTPAARNETLFDEASYLLNDYGAVVQWSVPSVGRGNATTVKNWYDASNSNSFIQSHVQFDQCGNPRKTWDANGNYSEMEYWSYNNSYGFPILTRNAVPDSSGSHGSSTALVSTKTFEFATGLRLSSTDPNGMASMFEYSDYLDRLTRQTSGAGTSLQNQTTITYADATHQVTVTSDLWTLNDNLVKRVTVFDGLGRSTESREYEPNGNYHAVQSKYDAFNRQFMTSNPFRPSEIDSTHPILWTTQRYDSIGRATETETADGAKILKSYDGVRTLETDQAGKQRLTSRNALGQIINVWDVTPSDSATESISFPGQSLSAGYKTGYLYDPLNNLAAVVQGGQSRSFVYNGISRLTQAVNPESGTVNYIYDSNGNVTRKTDARGVQTDYTYDALNRVTGRSYSTPGGTPSNYQAAPNVSFYYDNATNAKGKLVKIDSTTSATEFTSFDILGRLTSHRQTTDGVSYTTGYSYNLYGDLDEESYPSTRVVKNVVNSSGELSMVESRKNSSSGFWAYANSFAYTAAGSVSSLQLGNGRWESTQFNSRMQPRQIALGTLPGGLDQLRLDFEYGVIENGTLNPAKNNGNIQSEAIVVPTDGAFQGFTAAQSYVYDSLNRIASGSETISSVQSWKQEFNYDRYGNRSLVTGTGHTTTIPSGCPDAVCNPSYNTSNRFASGQGYAYNSSGSITTDASGNTFVYDSENKQVEVRNSSSAIVGQYAYDGAGRRVKKIVPSTGETTIFVYDSFDREIAEYSTIVANSSNAKVNYLTTDHLGSARIDSDANGSVLARHDYLPFGEELTASITSQRTYPNDTVREKFTGFERDAETDLDFAQARYFDSGLGRFSSPDGFANDTHPNAPQSWNLYAYVRNNPLLYVDKTGRTITVSYKDQSYKYEIDAAGNGTFTATDGTVVTKDNEALKLFNRVRNSGYKAQVDDLIKNGSHQFWVGDSDRARATGNIDNSVNLAYTSAQIEINTSTPTLSDASAAALAGEIMTEEWMSGADPSKIYDDFGTTDPPGSLIGVQRVNDLSSARENFGLPADPLLDPPPGTPYRDPTTGREIRPNDPVGIQVPDLVLPEDDPLPCPPKKQPSDPKPPCPKDPKPL